MEFAGEVLAGETESWKSRKPTPGENKSPFALGPCVDVGASVRRVLEIEVPFARGRPWQFDILQIFLGNISLDLVRARSRR